MRLRKKLLTLIAGLALFCPLAIYHYNANASEESTYYNNSSYNSQPRQPYNYYDDESDINTGSTAGTYDKNYTGSQPHDSEVQSALKYLHATSNKDANVQDLSGDKVPERMEYTPDPVDLKIYYYGYDSTNPNNTNLGYSVNDYQFNKGDTVNMGEMIKRSGDSSVNIMEHPNSFVINKNTLISIPVSEKVNAMINVTPVTANGDYDGPEFSINNLQPNQQFNLSNYMENKGYNPINKNYIITVPDGINEGLNSDYKIALASNPFNSDSVEPNVPHATNSENSEYNDEASIINSELSKADTNPYDPSYPSSTAKSLSESPSYTAESGLASNSSNYSNNSLNYDIPKKTNNHSKSTKDYNTARTKRKHIHSIKKLKKRLHSRRSTRQIRKSHKRRRGIRHYYISKSLYRRVVKFRRFLYRKSRRISHHSRKYKQYRKAIKKINRVYKYIRIRK